MSSAQPRVIFDNDELEIEVARDTTLAAAAEEVGATLPFGCRAGTCGTCVVEVLEGAEDLDEPGYVEQDTLAVVGAEDPSNRLGCQIILRKGSLTVCW